MPYSHCSLLQHCGQLTDGAKQVFDSLLSAANTQIAAAGLTAPELTIENYSSVLEELIESLSDENAQAIAEQTARDTVTATVESQRELIRQGVENAVRKQVTEAVLAQAGMSMTADEYDAAVDAGQIPDDVQTQISEGVQRMAGGGACLQALKAQLDSYNTFYNGIISYTAGVDQANSGALQILNGTDAVKNGSGELASGSAQLKSGTGQLNSGTNQLKNGSATLKDGSSKLASGAGELSAGTGRLHFQNCRNRKR